jgi:hypothetical protein
MPGPRMIGVGQITGGLKQVRAANPALGTGTD